MTARLPGVYAFPDPIVGQGTATDDEALIGEYAAWIMSMPLGTKVRRDRVNKVRAFQAWLDGAPLLEVTHADLVLFTHRRELAKNTIINELSMLRCFYKWAFTRGHVAFDATVMPTAAMVTFDDTETLTIAEHLASLKRRNLRPSYVDARRNALGALRRALDCPLLDASRDDLAVWYAGLKVSAGERGRQRAHAREFYRWAMLEELIEKDPTLRLERPKIPARLPRPMPDVQVADALDHAPPVVRQILYLAAFAGLRAMEIAPLRRDDVNDDVLIVRDGKGGRQRVVPLAAELFEVLDAPEIPGSGWLFPLQYSDGHLHRTHICKLANSYLHDRGITHTLHTLRHWFATNVYRNTKDLRLTQDLMGHASPATTAMYTMLDPDAGAAAIASLRIPR